MLYNVLYMCLLSYVDKRERVRGVSGRSKIPRLARPLRPTDDERKVTVKTDFVKLISDGDSVFRPNVVIQRNAESIPDPASMDIPGLARPLPPTDDEQKVTTKTDFVKLICDGHAVFRPNLVIQRNAESLSDPVSMDQSTQTDDDHNGHPVPDAQLSNSADADTGPLVPFPNPFNLNYFPNIYPAPNANPSSALLDPLCPRCGRYH